MQRNTKQRRAIEDVFRVAERPLGPEEILDRARQQVRGMGPATVYRTIASFLEERLIVPVDIPGHPSRYELSGLKHHHHFACVGCGRVFELEGCPYNGNTDVPPGFTVTGHEVILYGKCKSCG
ncbi:MAG: Fur family transcriptional regulator [Kiritimatiellia bacterium]